MSDWYENSLTQDASSREVVAAFVIPAKAGIHEQTPHDKTPIEKPGTTSRLVVPAEAGIGGRGMARAYDLQPPPPIFIP